MKNVCDRGLSPTLLSMEHEEVSDTLRMSLSSGYQTACLLELQGSQSQLT